MGIKLVIADDAPFIREIIRSCVEELEIEVVGEASNGEEAVKLALETTPDIVLMDIVMPVKNGIQASAEILEVLPNCRIIVVSTVDQQDMVLNAIALGCTNYLLKPFKKTDLKKIIHSCFQTKEKKHG